MATTHRSGHRRRTARVDSTSTSSATAVNTVSDSATDVRTIGPGATAIIHAAIAPAHRPIHIVASTPVSTMVAVPATTFSNEAANGTLIAPVCSEIHASGVSASG